MAAPGPQADWRLIGAATLKSDNQLPSDGIPPDYLGSWISVASFKYESSAVSLIALVVSGRKLDLESTSFARYAAYQPDCPAMQFGKLLDEGQPDSQPVAYHDHSCIGLLEELENARLLVGWDADTVVGNDNAGAVSAATCGDLDAPALRRVPCRIANDIADHLNEARLVDVE